MKWTAVLQEPWTMFHGAGDKASILVNKESGKQYRISGAWEYVLKSLDGNADFMSYAFMPEHRKILIKLENLGIARIPCRYHDIKGVLWAITRKCNLKCRHCNMNASADAGYEPSYSELSRVLEELETGGVQEIAFTGGEPFYHQDFEKLVSQLYLHGISLKRIYTNGLLVNQSFLDMLSKRKMFPEFMVSFDGLGAHDWMRGTKGIELATLAGIQRICAAGFPVHILTSADERCFPQLRRTYECMKKLKVTSWGISRPIAIGRAKENIHRIETAEFFRHCEEILGLWLKDDKPFEIGLEAFYSADQKGRTGYGEHPFDSASYVCSSCRHWPYVSPEGILMPCQNYEETKYASEFSNLIEIDWKSAWQNKTLRMLSDITRGQVCESNSACEACEYLDICGTGCRVMALLGGNGLMGTDVNCCEILKGGYRQRMMEQVN